MTIEQTIPFENAASTDWDVVVVGAGPAGALAARELARLGCQVLLIDKSRFPRDKVCGCCLNPRSLSILKEAGLGQLPATLRAVEVEDILLAAGGRQARLRLPGGVSLSRRAFDAALVEAAIQHGVEFLPGTRGQVGRLHPFGRELIARQEEHTAHLWPRIVIAADGLGGGAISGLDELASEVKPSSRIGAGVIVRTTADAYQPSTIYMACGRGGYVGLVRLEDGQLNVAAAFDPAFVKLCVGLGAAAGQIVAEAGLSPVAGLVDAQWRGTPALTRRLYRVACERTFVLGDAAGYVEPFTGEGIFWALASAVAVAPIAQRAARKWDSAFVNQWIGVHRRIVVHRQLICQLTAGMLRFPNLTQSIVHTLSIAPRLASPVIRILQTTQPARVGASRA